MVESNSETHNERLKKYHMSNEFMRWTRSTVLFLTQSIHFNQGGGEVSFAVDPSPLGGIPIWNEWIFAVNHGSIKQTI